jgi:hypothetical protein
MLQQFNARRVLLARMPGMPCKAAIIIIIHESPVSYPSLHGILTQQSAYAASNIARLR